MVEADNVMTVEDVLLWVKTSVVALVFDVSVVWLLIVVDVTLICLTENESNVTIK